MHREKNRQRRILLGRVAGAHGVRGWVRVFSYTDPRQAILDYRPWLVGAQELELTPLEGGRHGKSVIARLEGVDDRDQAMALIGLDIKVDRGQLPDPGEARYYWADLIGMHVVLEDGETLGTIEEMMATGANDVMVVDGARQRLIPFVRGQTVMRVDIENNEVTVRWDRDF